MKSSDASAPDSLALTYGAWLVRLWLAVRAIQTGIEKYAGSAVSEKVVDVDGAPNAYGLTDAASAKSYALSNYHGVPEALYKKFSGEPLIPDFFLKFYDWILGPALLVLGVTILVGFASRTSLFLLGVLYVSLTWGMILLGGQAGNSGVAWLGIHMVLIVMALQLSKYNRLCILKKW